MSSITLGQFSDHWWTEICKKVKRSVVFIDSASAECLHWNGGLLRLQAAGALSVKELSSFESASPDHKKAVFVVSGPVVNLKADIVGSVIRASAFEYCQVITDASPGVHKAARYPGRPEVEEQRLFAELEEQVLEWMGNMNYTCEVFYMPFHSVPISDSLFVTPSFSHLFPLLDVDIKQAFEKWKARHNVQQQQESSSSQSTTALSHELLPYEVRVAVAHWAASFHSLFQMLGVREDIFTIGGFSRVLGEQLEQLPAARARRKTAQSPVSLILVDRTLDMAGPTRCGFESLLGKIKAVLPSFPDHVNDVQVDVSPLFGLDPSYTAEELLPAGNLAPANFQKSTAQSKRIRGMMMEEEGKVLGEIHKALAKGCKEVQVTNEATVEDLEEALEAFKLDDELIKSNLEALLTARAAVIANKSPRSKTIARIKDLEDKFVANFSKTKEMRSFLVHVAKIVRLRKDKGFSLEDILVFLTHFYALLPPGEAFYPEDEDRLQSALSEAIVRDRSSLGPVLGGMVPPGDEVDEITAFQVVKKIFLKLNSLRVARSKLQAYHRLHEGGSYRPLLARLFDDVFAEDRRDVPDLEHRSGGLGGLLKSGIGLFGVSVTKRHPRENPSVWVYVVGGVTADEAREVRRLVESRSKCELVVGATKLLGHDEALKSLFVHDPLTAEAQV